MSEKDISFWVSSLEALTRSSHCLFPAKKSLVYEAKTFCAEPIDCDCTPTLLSAEV